MSSTPGILVAAAGVGFGHAVLPDHWLPLATVGRTQRYSLGRVARLSGLAGAAHVLVSVLLGAVIVVVGLGFRSRVEHAQDAIVGSLLVLTGIGVLVLGNRHSHDEEGHGHGHPHGAEHGHSHGPRLLAVLVPFGAAASPDLTILPVFLAAAATGTGAAIGSLIVFATVTIATFVVLTLLATAGGYRLGGGLLDRGGHLLTAGVLILIGGLVLAGIL